MSKLITVSNRVGVPSPGSGRAGGLESALREALEADGGIWFGWSGEVGETRSETPKIQKKGNVTFATVDLCRADYEDYYLGYANSTLWPLLHYQLGLVEFHRKQFQGYIAVNEYLARMLLPLIEPDDLIWVHDYHLIPLAEELRKLGVKNRIGFFLHTPFPATDIMVALPHHEVIMRALCAYDLVGLQTENGVRAFLDYIAREANGRLEFDGSVSAYDRLTRVVCFPIGIDTEGFAKNAVRAVRSAEATRLRESIDGRQLIIGVDRMDYSKGVRTRFEAIDDLLTEWPEEAAKFTYLQITPPSRSDVLPYQALRREVEHAAGHVNGKYSDIDWAPIRFVARAVSRPALAGIYRSSRIGLVTPWRDGMNLVAKEYVASQNPENPGVLVLSRFAGAAAELKTALLVNPLDPSEIAAAIHQALKMGLPERRERWELMMEVLRNNTIDDWLANFLKALKATRPLG
ncbi:MAG: trehalose-6-phosphate synthase [Rhodospirillales bacterium]|nr:trehalose-6-phosphate synthase [Rhodospirillales bacterium]